MPTFASLFFCSETSADFLVSLPMPLRRQTIAVFTSLLCLLVCYHMPIAHRWVVCSSGVRIVLLRIHRRSLRDCRFRILPAHRRRCARFALHRCCYAVHRRLHKTVHLLRACADAHTALLTLLPRWLPLRHTARRWLRCHAANGAAGTRTLRRFCACLLPLPLQRRFLHSLLPVWEFTATCSATSSSPLYVSSLPLACAICRKYVSHLSRALW